MNDEKKDFFKMLRLLKIQSEHGEDISHLFDDYDNLVENPSESTLVPHHGSCTGIKDEYEIIDEIKKVIDKKIKPDKIISVENYLLRLRIIFSESLAHEEKVLKMGMSDSFTFPNIIITKHLLIWIDEQISRIIKPEETFVTLPEMFGNKVEKLNYYCELLKKKGYIEINENLEKIWIGKSIVTEGNNKLNRGDKLQLVALSWVMRRFFICKYSDKEIHKAFTDYFNCKTSPTIFKTSKKHDSAKYEINFKFLFQN